MNKKLKYKSTKVSKRSGSTLIASSNREAQEHPAEHSIPRRSVIVGMPLATQSGVRDQGDSEESEFESISSNNTRLGDVGKDKEDLADVGEDQLRSLPRDSTIVLTPNKDRMERHPAKMSMLPVRKSRPEDTSFKSSSCQGLGSTPQQTAYKSTSLTNSRPNHFKKSFSNKKFQEKSTHGNLHKKMNPFIQKCAAGGKIRARNVYQDDVAQNCDQPQQRGLLRNKSNSGQSALREEERGMTVKTNQLPLSIRSSHPEENEFEDGDILTSNQNHSENSGADLESFRTLFDERTGSSCTNDGILSAIESVAMANSVQMAATPHSQINSPLKLNSPTVINQPFPDEIDFAFESNLFVALRIRPLSKAETEAGATKIAQRVDENMIVLFDPGDDLDDILRVNRSREKKYLFDQVFDLDASQEAVYESTTKPLIQSVINGYNATVFAYGATGAGKTYTMLGTEHSPGIMALTLNDLFTKMNSLHTDYNTKVTLSYLEIYNEMIRDLLHPESGVLDLREDAKGDCHVAGIVELSTSTADEVMTLLQKGNMERTQEPTAANKTSSRSHAVLQVTVKLRNKVPSRKSREETQTAKLFMIDLAGSERAAQTKNVGKRLVEGAHINRSLLALGNVINSLTDPSKKGGSQYVNYRDSKLTRILKDALGGNCRTVMIANISPSSNNFDNSRSTLLYADRARKIKTKVKRNLSTVSYHVAQYTAIINDLRKEILRLKTKIEDQELIRSKTSSKIHHAQSELNKVVQSEQAEFQHLRSCLLENFQEIMETKKGLLEVDSNLHEINVEITLQQKPLNEAPNCESGASREETKDDLISLIVERKRLEEVKRDFSKRVETSVNCAHKLEEMISSQLCSEEQQEILSLLCKVHELELANAEITHQNLIQENLLTQRDIVLERLMEHKSICHNVINLQKTQLTENGLHGFPELDEQYHLYEVQLDEMLKSIHRTFPPGSQRDSGYQEKGNWRVFNSSQRLFNSVPNKHYGVITKLRAQGATKHLRFDEPECTLKEFEPPDENIMEKKEIMLGTKDICLIAAKKKNDSQHLQNYSLNLKALNDISEDESAPNQLEQLQMNSDRNKASTYRKSRNSWQTANKPTLRDGRKHDVGSVDTNSSINNRIPQAKTSRLLRIQNNNKGSYKFFPRGPVQEGPTTLSKTSGGTSGGGRSCGLAISGVAVSSTTNRGSYLRRL